MIDNVMKQLYGRFTSIAMDKVAYEQFSF